MPNSNTIKDEQNHLINSIANTIILMLPSTWIKVILGYFVIDETLTTRTQIHMRSNDLNDYVDLMELSWQSDEYEDVFIEIQKQCDDLRSACRANKENWNAITLTLLSDGSFNIDYDYAVIENYDSKFILKWQSRYLD